MKEKIEARLQSLTAEFKAGQEMLAELEAREANLRITLARISGAIQVLEELLSHEESAFTEGGTSAKRPTAATI